MGFLLLYDFVYVVVDEWDLIGVCSDVCREWVYLFCVYVMFEIVCVLFVDYLCCVYLFEGCLEFYNMLFNNCMMNILCYIWVVVFDVGYSWKVLLSGYVD